MKFVVRNLFCLLILLGILLLESMSLSAQVYVLDDNLDGAGIVTCSGTFYDSGGAAGNYMNDEDYVVTFCSANAGEPINLSMIIDTEPTFDLLTIYDGPTTSSAQFPGSPFGGSTSFTVTSSATCITVAFSSGSIVTEAGWEGEISCGVIDLCTADITQTYITTSSCFSCDGTVGFDNNGLMFPADLSLFLDGGLVLNQAFAGGALDFTDLCPGNYELVIEDASNCIYTEAFEIMPGDFPICAVSDVADFCEGSSVDLTLDLTRTPPWTLQYMLDGIPQTPLDVPSTPFTWTIDQAGFYELLEISDFDCSSPLVESYTIQELSTPSAVLNGNGSFCTGSFADLEIELTGTAPWTISYTYEGIPQADIITSSAPHAFPVTAEGVYELIAVTDANCVGNASGMITVIESNAPTATLSGGGNVCEGESTALFIQFTGGGPYTFIYALDGVDQDPLTVPFNIFSADLDVPGSYTLTSVSSGACFGMVSGQADIILDPAPVLILPSGDNVEMCQGGMVDIPMEFEGSGPWTLEYSLDFGPSIVLDIASSPYTFTATQTGFYSFGPLTDQVCSAADAGFTNVSLSDAPSATLDQDLIFCTGGSSALPVTISDAGTYDLSYAIDGNPQASITITGPDAFIPVSRGRLQNIHLEPIRYYHIHF